MKKFLILLSLSFLLFPSYSYAYYSNSVSFTFTYGSNSDSYVSSTDIDINKIYVVNDSTNNRSKAFLVYFNDTSFSYWTSGTNPRSYSSQLRGNIQCAYVILKYSHIDTISIDYPIIDLPSNVTIIDFLNSVGNGYTEYLPKEDPKYEGFGERLLDKFIDISNIIFKRISASGHSIINKLLNIFIPGGGAGHTFTGIEVRTNRTVGNETTIYDPLYITPDLNDDNTVDIDINDLDVPKPETGPYNIMMRPIYIDTDNNYYYGGWTVVNNFNTYFGDEVINTYQTDTYEGGAVITNEYLTTITNYYYDTTYNQETINNFNDTVYQSDSYNTYYYTYYEYYYTPTDPTSTDIPSYTPTINTPSASIPGVNTSINVPDFWQLIHLLDFPAMLTSLAALLITVLSIIPGFKIVFGFLPLWACVLMYTLLVCAFTLTVYKVMRKFLTGGS